MRHLSTSPRGLYAVDTPAHAQEALVCRGGRIHTQWGCREVLFEETSQGAEATGLRMTKAGKEQIVEADVYVAALDVPGAPCSSSSVVEHM